MISAEYFTLANGVKIPKLGLGTWLMENNNAAKAVYEAARLGYRHFDTAEVYHNEQGVGEGIRQSGLARKDIFITTKLDAVYKNYKTAQNAIEDSLKALGTDYIDLMLIHSPRPWDKFHDSEPYDKGNLEAWRALEEAYKAGKLRAVGVSNFEKAHLDNILNNSATAPMVNQILAHIGNTPFELIKYCQSKNILAEAYSPIAHGAMLGNQDLAAMAAQYKISVAQLCLRYCLQLNMLPLPKTENPAHMRNNAELDFSLSAADMEKLKNAAPLKDYGEANKFPVYGGTMGYEA